MPYKEGECLAFCECCGDCLHCYGNGVDCWWCTPDPEDPGGCERCASRQFAVRED